MAITSTWSLIIKFMPNSVAKLSPLDVISQSLAQEDAHLQCQHVRDVQH